MVWDSGNESIILLGVVCLEPYVGGWDKLGEIWRSQICRFCGAGLGRILATLECFLVRKLLNLWNSWSILNQCQTGNCTSIFQNSLVGKRDLCIRKNSSGTF